MGAFVYALPNDRITNQAFSEYINRVCDANDLNVLEVLGDHRRQELVTMRHLLMTIAYHEFGFTVTSIGKMFGRDHSLVSHAKDKMRGILKSPVHLKQRPFLHKCVLSADEVYHEQWGHNFQILSEWLIKAKSQ